jgi:hypothetical protein
MPGMMSGVRSTWRTTTRLSINNTPVVAARPVPRLVAGQLSAADFPRVVLWVALNEAALVGHWDGQISGVELGRRLRRLREALRRKDLYL